MLRLAEASEKVDVVRAGSVEEAADLIADADATYGVVTPGLLRTAKRLKWVQAPCIGLENYIFPELIDHACILTNVRGIFSDHIANHVFAFILCFARDLHRHLRNQEQAHWGCAGEDHPVLHLADQTLGIREVGEMPWWHLHPHHEVGLAHLLLLQEVPGQRIRPQRCGNRMRGRIVRCGSRHVHGNDVDRAEMVTGVDRNRLGPPPSEAHHQRD